MGQVSRLTKIAYGLGHGPISAKNTLFHFFFMFYFSNVLGMAEGTVFLALLIALLFDAFSDPIMGQISDNFRSEKWGRRHGFMLAGTIPTAIALALLFAPPASLDAGGLFLWILGFAIIVRIGLTVYGVPYYTLGAELSTDYDERTQVFAYREFFNTFLNLGIFLIGILVFLKATPEFENGMLNGAGYPPFVTIVALFGLGFSLISIFGTRRKIHHVSRFDNDERTRWTQTLTELKKAFRISPFVWLCCGYSLLVILYAGSSGLGFYHLIYQWKLTEAQTVAVIIAPLITLLPAAILASVLSRKFSKQKASIMLGLIYMACIILPNAAYLMGMLPEMGSEALLLIICIFNGLGFMGFIGVVITSNSMMADVVDVMDQQTGKRQEGILFSAFSFAQKLTFVVGTLIVAVTLTAIKFPKQMAPSEVPQNIIDNFAVASILTALIFGLASLYCFSKYGLTKEKLEQVQADIANN